jgi:nicotinamidase-related amidase
LEHKSAQEQPATRGIDAEIVAFLDDYLNKLAESHHFSGVVLFARDENVFFHRAYGLVYGSPEWQWVPELVPAEGEPLIHKHYNSAFEQTALEDQLAGFGATHIVLAGAATNWCIRATAYGVLDRGWKSSARPTPRWCRGACLPSALACSRMGPRRRVVR